MPQFAVDDETVALLWKLANPKPFENLTFQAALRRVLLGFAQSQQTRKPEGSSRLDANALLAELAMPPGGRKRAPTPSPQEWVTNVPQLKDVAGLTTWQAICAHLKIQTGGDSARRKLKAWVERHHPAWQGVPDADA